MEVFIVQVVMIALFLGLGGLDFLVAFGPMIGVIWLCLAAIENSEQAKAKEQRRKV